MAVSPAKYAVGILTVVWLAFMFWFTAEVYQKQIAVASNTVRGNQVGTNTSVIYKFENPPETDPKKCPSKEPGFIPSPDEIDKLDHKSLEYIYHTFCSNIEVICHEMIRMGKIGWGGWEMCNDTRYRPKPGCIVYSFGIQNDFSFDDAMQQVYQCKVYSFDPSMGKPDHQHAKDVQFFNTGLSGKGVKKKGWKLKTVGEIRAELGHTNSRIDVMKIDVEDSEWSALTSALQENSLQNVNQLHFEYHSINQSPNGLRMRLELLHGVRKLGFRAFYSHKNYACKTKSKFRKRPELTICHEVHMVKLDECVGVGS